MTDDKQAALMKRLRFGVWRDLPFIFVLTESLPQRCAQLAGADVDATWLGNLAAVVEEMPLLDADDATGLGAALLAAAAPAALSFSESGSKSVECAPDQQRRTAARGLVQLAGQLGRMKAWAGAQQAAVLATLGRPGVAVPVGELLDAVTQGGSGGPVGVGSAGALRAADFEADAWEQVSVSGDPGWDDAVHDQAMRIAAAEVGAQLAWSPMTARSRMHESTDVVDNLPLAHRLWSQGRLDRSRVAVLAARTVDLDPAARALVEEQLLADGGAVLRSKTPARVRTLVDRCAAELDPDAVRRRQERARQDRDVFVAARGDGMSRFCAEVSTPVAVLARSVIDSVAQGLSSERSIGQRRADVFADLFTRLAAEGHVDLRGGAPHDAAKTDDAPHPGHAPTADDAPTANDAPETVDASRADGAAWTDGPEVPASEIPSDDAAGECTDLLPTDWDSVDSGVTVAIDASVLEGVDLADTAQIEGALLGSHPALPTELVQALALSARRARIAIRGAGTTGRTNEDAAAPCASGCASARTNLTVGADVYRPSARLVEQVVLRDRVCRFPGCRHPARRCDLDHRVPFADDGPTTAENLDALCRFHHRLKTFTRWRAVREPGNRLTWTSPLGARITDEPELAAPPEVMTPSRPPADDPPPF